MRQRKLKIVQIKKAKSQKDFGAIWFSVFGLFSIFFALIVPAQAGPIAPTFFGLHHSGQLSNPWPSVNFGTERFWDIGAAWAQVNTSAGAYDFSVFDQWVNQAQAHNVDILYDLGRTPFWATSDQGDTSCDYGPGQCDAPSDIAGSNQIWKNWVTTVVTRYKGKIKYYEIWNEPNNSNWHGTAAQLATLAKDARTIIKQIDPQAQIVSPAPAPGGGGQQTAVQFMTAFLQAGGGASVDVFAFHGYVGGSPPVPEGVTNEIDNMQNLLNSNGQQGKPLFDSEGSWGKNINLTDPVQEANFLARWYLVAAGKGIPRVYWYAWDNTAWGTLWTSANGINPAGVAYGQIYDWLVGATMAAPCSKDANSTWTCHVTRTGNYQGLVVWNAQGTFNYTPPASGYVQYRDLAGKSTAYSQGTVQIGSSPIIFETTISGIDTTPPVISTVTAKPSTVTGTSTKLSAVAHDSGNPDSSISYNWSAVTPPAPVSFSPNGTNASSNTVAVFQAVGTYALQVVAQDPFGNLSTPLSVKVIVVPTISGLTVSPLSTTVQENRTQQFTAKPTDQFGKSMTSPPPLLWTVPAAAGTVNSSGLFTAAGSAGGPYTLKVSTSSLGSLKATATITVTADVPPAVSLTAPLDGATYTAPASIVLKATITPGTDPISSVQFMQGATVLKTFTNPTGTSFTFTWANVNAGNYALGAVVQDTKGSSNSSTVANIKVSNLLIPPTITSSPKDQSILAGQSANLSVAASGTGPLSYQWQYALPGSSFFYDVPGVVNTVYITGPLALSDSGTRFRCQVTNSAGMATSNTAIVTVTVAGNVSLPAPTLNLPSYLAVNGALAAGYPSNYSNISFQWAISPASGSPYGAPFFGNPKIISRSGTASFRTSSAIASLASYILDPGYYTITVQAVDADNNMSAPVSANVTLVAADLSRVQVYPNPWRADKHAGKSVTFSNLTVNTTVKIFTVSGHHVKTLPPTDTFAIWDLTNDSGDKVASGVYVYLITTGDAGSYGSSGMKKTGKIGVIK